MTKKLKKSLATLLAMSMILSMVSVSAFAAGEGDELENNEPGTETVVTEGEKKEEPSEEPSEENKQEGEEIEAPEADNSLIKADGELNNVGGEGEIEPMAAKQPTITVEYYANYPDGTTQKVGTQKSIYNSLNKTASVTLAFPECSFEGYELVRWATSETTTGNSSDESYQNGAKISSTTTKTQKLYARWEKTVAEADAAVQVTANGTTRNYETLQDALDAAYDGHYYEKVSDWTVTLQKDVTESVNVRGLIAIKNSGTSFKLTLDLNGYTITGNGGPVITFSPLGSAGVTPCELIITGEGTVTGGTESAVCVSGNNGRAKLTIENGTFTGNSSDNGGAISASLQDNVPVVINGGTFTGNTATGNGGAVYARDLTVNGGEFTGNSADKGGAIYVVGAGWTADLAVSNAKIYGNTATTYGDDIVFGLSGSSTRRTTLSLVDAADMGIESVDAWLVDGYNLTEECDRVTGTHREAFAASQWPNTNSTGGAIIALKADLAEPVAVIGATGYATLQGAIDAANVGDTVTLVKDTITESVTVAKGQEIILDLNGKTLEGSNGHTLTNRGTLTIQDGASASVARSEAGKIVGMNIGGKPYSAVVNENGATCTIKSGMITRAPYLANEVQDNVNTNSNYTVQNKGAMYIKGGLIVNNSSKSSMVVNLNNQGKLDGKNVHYGQAKGVYMEVSGGVLQQDTFTALKNDPNAEMVIKDGAQIINNSSYVTQFYGNVTIEGGSFTGGQLWICSHADPGGDYPTKVEITGGTLNLSEVKVIYAFTTVEPQGTPKAELIIKGGDFTCDKWSEEAYNRTTGSREPVADKEKSAIVISDGVFSCDVTPYCVEGSMATDEDNDGRWIIVPDTDSVASIGSKGYPTLQAALDAAVEGDTVVLLKNTAEKILISGKKNITLDCTNGTITGVAGEHGVQVYCSDNVTLKNVTVTGAGKSGLLVNASTVTVEGKLDLGGNGGDSFWAMALNVSFGASVTGKHDTSLTFAEGATLEGVTLVYSDKGDVARAEAANSTITINPVPGLVEVKGSAEMPNCWTTEQNAENQAVAKIVKGGTTTYYAALQTAIDEAVNGDTVVMLKSVTTNQSVNVAQGKKIELDLNGTTYTFTTKDETAIKVAGGELTLKNSKSEGKLVTSTTGNNTHAMYIGSEGGKIVIDQTALVEGRVAVFGGELEVAGTIDTAALAIPGIMGNGNCHDTKITVTGTVTAGDKKIAIYHPQRGELTIDGGTVEGYAGIGIKSGTLNIINGATVKGLANDADLNDSHSNGNGITNDGSAIVIDTHTSYDGNMVINIVDSKVESAYSYAIREIKNVNADKTNVVKLVVSGDSAEVYGAEVGCIALKDTSVGAITGGTFSENVTEYCAEGYIARPNGNGTYTVGKRVSSTLTTDIGTKDFVVGQAVEFTFTTTANDDKLIPVIGTSNFSNAGAIEKLEYYEVRDGKWYELPVGADFGVSTGFPMSDATSKFRVTFKTAGTYTFTASMKKAGTNEVLCSTEVEFTVREAVASIGEVKYGTLQAAVNAAVNGNTVTLLKDVTVTGQGVQINDKEITLDLGDQTITGEGISSAYGAVNVNRGSVVTIVGNGGGITADGVAVYLYASKTATVLPKLTVNGGTYKGNTAGCLYAERGDITVLDGHFSCDEYNGKCFVLNKKDSNKELCTFVVSGGTFVGCNPAANNNENPVENQLAEGYAAVETETGVWTVSAASVSLSGATSVYVGSTTTLTANVTPEGATVTWSSSDETVATVSETGVVTGIANGTATITATVDNSNGVSATREIRVSTYVPYTPPTPSTPDTGDEDLEDPDTPLADRPWLFVDVHEGDYFYDAVKRLFDKNVVGGTTDTTYEPYTDATRGMVAQILYGMAGSPDVTGLEMPFSDVSESDFYYKAVLWGYANKVLGGYPEDNTFRGENTITREELAALLHQYGVEKLGLADTKGDLSGFIDAAEISDWAVEHMKWAVGMEIMHGDDAKKLMPVDNTIRADMTIMLNNLDMKVSDEK